jgi:hypothetical protein
MITLYLDKTETERFRADLEYRAETERQASCFALAAKRDLWQVADPDRRLLSVGEVWIEVEVV